MYQCYSQVIEKIRHPKDKKRGHKMQRSHIFASSTNQIRVDMEQSVMKRAFKISGQFRKIELTTESFRG